MRNVTIKTRVFALGVATIAGMLVLLGLLLVEKSRVASEMESLNRLANLAPTVSALVHELQKERGASVGFIAGEGRRFADTLAGQKALTDEKRAALADALAAFDAAAYGAGLVAKLDEAEAALARLDEERAEIAGLSRTVTQTLGFYTPAIARLLAVVEEMAVLSTDARVGNAITAYTSLLKAKERAGLERATGLVSFGTGAFAPATHRRLVRLIAMQETFLGVFVAYASDEQKRLYEETLGGDAVGEVERLRRIALDYPASGSTAGVDGAVWFDAASERIDLLKAVEGRVAADLEALTAEILGDARSALTAVIALVALLLAATIVLSLAVARGITAPVKAITAAMRLAEGGRQVAVPATERKDEIGEMARAVEVFKDSMVRLDTAEEALRRSEEWLSMALKAAKAGAWAWNMETGVRAWSDESRPLFGYEPGSAEITYERWFERVHPSDREAAQARFDAAVAVKGDLDHEYRALLPDDSIRWIRDIGRMMFDRDGKPIGMYGIQVDVTERERTEETLRRSQKLEAIGQLTGGVAHDFNNLLGIIIGNLDLLEDEVAGNEAAAKQVAAALRSALRGAELTKRLLAFANQSAGAASPIDLNKVLVWMDTLLRRSLTAEVALEMDLADDLWLTEVDKGDFEDAIVNLAINARDAMPEGGRLVIETCNWVADASMAHAGDVGPGDYVQVTVSDTGTGMPAATVEKIFEPFFTTKEPGRGTGLGLSMVYGFVKRSRGHIRVYSDLGYGTTFRMHLPRAGKASDVETVAETVTEELPLGDETILVVDDEDDMAAFVKTALEKLGYGVLAAADAEEALRVLERNDSVDLLLTDVVMPGEMSGFELASTAREKYPDLTVLLGSGFTQRTQRSEKYPELARDMIAKPYRASDLARRVRRALDGARSRR